MFLAIQIKSADASNYKNVYFHLTNNFLVVTIKDFKILYKYLTSNCYSVVIVRYKLLSDTNNKQIMFSNN